MYNFKIITKKMTIPTLLTELKISHPNEDKTILLRIAYQELVSTLLPPDDQIEKKLQDFLNYLHSIEKLPLLMPIPDFKQCNCFQESCKRGYDKLVEAIIEIFQLTGEQQNLFDAAKTIKKSRKIPTPLNFNKNKDWNQNNKVSEQTLSFIDKPANSGYTALVYSVLTNQLPTAACLLSKGANPNYQDNLGQTPLHHAVISDNNEIVAALIDAEAKADIKDGNDLAPIHHAMKAFPINYDLIEILLPYSHTVLKVNENNLLHEACEIDDLPLFNQLIPDLTNLINQVNHDQQSPIHIAAEKLSFHKIQSLIKFHANLYAQDNKKRFPIEILAEKIRENSLPLKRRIEYFNLFLNAGFDLNKLSQKNKEEIEWLMTAGNIQHNLTITK